MGKRKLPRDAHEAILRDRRSGATYQAIADRYGVTREWIRQVLKQLGAAGRLQRPGAPPANARE
jgi:transposase-like protein